MIAYDVTATATLLELLASRNDDGTPELLVDVAGSVWDARGATVELRHGVVIVTRHDGTELSATERAHVEATLAAFAAKPTE